MHKQDPSEHIDMCEGKAVVGGATSEGICGSANSSDTEALCL